ncbi:unnamed protein product [Urochloa decumbens]|uniref:F-box domain-containing protein n=1 Tax=Urochloa decumbens TaxID=240449 RepID=A0ABC8XWV1_9POAL
MATTFFAVPLPTFVDANEWEAADLAGRLGVVAHASFLYAGFVPYGAVPSSSHSPAPLLSRRYYTAPQLVRVDGADVAVLELPEQAIGEVAFRTYLLTSAGHQRCVYQAFLNKAYLAPILSGGVHDAARAVETGAAGAWLWRSLADWACRGPFLELCRWNDLPVTGFLSLPDDSKAEILKRLADGKDLARVECTSSQLRRLVAERDGELWKAMCETRGLLPDEETFLEVISWKERYVNALRPPPTRPWAWASATHRDRFDPPQHEELFVRLRQSLQQQHDELYATRHRVPVEDSSIADEALNPPLREVVARGRQSGRKHRKVPQKDYMNKRHGVGAIHSPSSRYRWKHR